MNTRMCIKSTISLGVDGNYKFKGQVKIPKKVACVEICQC